MTEYKLKTIKDIFDKVPADRIEVCMKELTQLLVTSKNTSEMLRLLTEDLSGQELPQLFTMPEEIIWRDDGKGEIESRFTFPDGQGLSVAVKRKAE